MMPRTARDTDNYLPCPKCDCVNGILTFFRDGEVYVKCLRCGKRGPGHRPPEGLKP